MIRASGATCQVTGRSRRSSAKTAARSAAGRSQNSVAERSTASGVRSATATTASDPGSVGDQPFPGELPLRLGEGDVAWWQDHVRLHELLVVDRRAVGLHEREHLVPELRERALVARFNRRDGLVVELVEALRVL